MSIQCSSMFQGLWRMLSQRLLWLLVAPAVLPHRRLRGLAGV